MPNPVLTCTAYDASTGVCTVEAWVEPSPVLPPLPAVEGLQLSGVVIGVAAAAWTWKFIRRFVSPKTG